jgi:hypothetical protein
LSTVAVAAHVHSDWSYDGSWTLVDLAQAFAARGCRAILMAEHDRTFDAARWDEYRDACAAASTPKLLIVPGIEYASPCEDIHVPVWGSGPFLGAGRPTGALLTDAAQAGRLAVIAHPRRRDVWRMLDPEWLALAHGLEVWNRKYDGWAPFAPACALTAEHDLVPYAGLDFHTARQFAPLRMSVELGRLDAEVVSEPALLAALAARRARPLVGGRLDVARLSSGPLRTGAELAESARRRGGALARETGLRR